MKEKFEMIGNNSNIIQDKRCRYCMKLAQFYRYCENDYVCKEHLFKNRY